jgi:hypothetical protein
LSVPAYNHLIPVNQSGYLNESEAVEILHPSER